MSGKSDQGTVRASNRRLLLRLLREQGPASRTDLADRSDLSSGAITRIISELIDEGFLVEQSIGVSTGGRRPVLLDLDTSVRVVAGLKLMDDLILAVLVDMKGAVVARCEVPLDGHGVDVVVDQIQQVVGDLLDGIAASSERLVGVGLCMPGSIDWRTGICKLSTYFAWTDVAIARLIEDRLGVPVAVDNDVNALAVAESLFEVGRTVRDFVVVTVGRGVGAGLVFNGSVFRGVSGGAGELGHTVSEVDGRRCECGKKGCLEAYIGDRALTTRLAEKSGSGHPNTFLARVEEGEPNARVLYRDVARRLGVAIADLVNVLNPELIVLGGEAGYLTEQFVADLRLHIDRNTFAGLAGSVTLQLDEWRADRTTWARGAATLAMERLFDPSIRAGQLALA